MQFTLSAQPPFSLPAVVRSHGWAQLAPFGIEEDSGRLTYVVRLESSRVVALAIGEAPDGVSVEVDAELDPLEQTEVGGMVSWMLGLDQEFDAFYALAQEEPKLARVVERAQGRLLRSPTLFEDVVRTISTTNTQWRATIRMNAALVDHFGAPLAADPARRAFPTPEQLAVLDEAALRSEARLGYRAPYVLELAQAVADGTLDLEALKSTAMPTPQLRKRLLAIKGVGNYAAANLLMILGRYDFLPIDSWALKMVSREWHDGEQIGPAEVEAAFARWGEWQGLAYWFWAWEE